MTTLIPSRYSDKTNSTFFDVAGLVITLNYEVVRRRRLWVLPGQAVARVEAKLGDGATLSHEYEITANRRVGEEIALVERGLYGFIDELVRDAVQRRALESTEREVESFEADHLFWEGLSGAARGSAEDARAGGAEAAARAFVEDLVGKVMTAVRHLTSITSLSGEGLEAYQRDRSQALEKVLRSTSLTSALQVQEVLHAVETFVHYEAESTADVNTLRDRTMNYLALLEARGAEAGPLITEAQAQVLANEFVPGFLKMKKSYDAAVTFPKDLVGHAFGSFFGGGITGYFVLSLFGEAVIRGVLGASVDLPGFYIGAALAFIWPYLRGIYGLLTREEQYERRRRALLERVGRRLELALPKGG